MKTMWNSGTTGNLLYFSYVFVHSLYRFKMLLTIELFVIILKKPNPVEKLTAVLN